MIYPMLLEKAPNNEPSDSDSLLNELKVDGIRLIAINNSKLKFYTRHGTDVTNQFPELQNIRINPNTVLDGELTITDENGKPDFDRLMKRFHSTKNKSTDNAQLVVFDILKDRGRDITKLPLIERKLILSNIPDNDFLTKSKYILGNGVQFFNLIKKEQLEGIVQKEKFSKYEIAKRSNKWLKVINYHFIDVYIGGFRKNKFGWLLNFEDGRYAGVLEFVPKKEKMILYNFLDELKIKEDNNYIYLKQLIKIKVKYRNLTTKGLLRIPSFVEFIV